MLKFLVLFILSLFASDKTKTKEPFIVEAHRTTPPEWCDDPLGCYSEVMTIENPLFKEVVVTLNCGTDLDEQEVAVSPRVRLQVEIELTIPPSEDLACKLTKWRYK